MRRWRERFRKLNLSGNKPRQYLGAAVAISALAFFLREREPYWIGVPFVVAGLAIRLWASGHLSKNEELATSGPYRYVRHPLYAGSLLAFLGVSFIAGSYWLALCVAATLLPAYLWRIRSEERELGERFGKSYEDYRRAVPALVPCPGRAAAPDGNRFSLRRAVVENRWHRGCLRALLGLIALDLVEDFFYPAFVQGRPLGDCLHELLDFTWLWRSGRF